MQYTRKELDAGSINWSVLTPPEYASLDLRALEEIAATGTCAPYEKEYVLRDGSRVPILIGSAAFEDNREEGVGFVLDLTERKKLEHQFLRSQRMEGIGTLAGGIAHDLNNILAPIMMSIVVLKELRANSEANELLETIELSAKRGADIVQQVLSYARGVKGERIHIHPSDLIKDLDGITKDIFPKNIRTQFSIPVDAWSVSGDRTQIHQILLNLCVNARDAMPKGGSLAVGTENITLDKHCAAMNIQARAGRYLTINVTDTGTGIPSTILGKVFEPFFTTKEVGQGTGLGLSTVLAIVKSHGGFVDVYSEPARGTTFKVYLPAIEGTSKPREKKLEKPAPSRGRGETILIVDDELSIRTIASKTLRTYGYNVLTACDGAEAVALYLENRKAISLVITDISMPIMDGTALIGALTKINLNIQIIAASGLTKNSAEASQMNVKAFLTKPYTAGTLLTAARTILDKSEINNGATVHPKKKH